jgi:uncharacterized glyoxalase superfamily protein PhnB
MDITIYQALLPHDDPDASPAFYRDTLGFEVRPTRPAPRSSSYPPAATPGITEDERLTIAQMMAKGTYASINLATSDLDGTFERLQASAAAEVVQEPTDQPYGIRDCSFRDPVSNLIRIQESH